MILRGEADVDASPSILICRWLMPCVSGRDIERRSASNWTDYTRMPTTHVDNHWRAAVGRSTGCFLCACPSVVIAANWLDIWPLPSTYAPRTPAFLRQLTSRTHAPVWTDHIGIQVLRINRALIMIVFQSIRSVTRWSRSVQFSSCAVNKASASELGLFRLEFG